MKWVEKKSGWKLLHLLTALKFALSLLLPCGVGIAESRIYPGAIFSVGRGKEQR